MEINTQTINLIKTYLSFPKKFGLPYLPLWKCFNIENTVTPQDKLYEQYINYIKAPLPKMVFYVILKMMYKQYQGIDKKSGNFGYRLSFVDPEYERRKFENEQKEEYLKQFRIAVNQPINREFLLEPHPAMLISDPVLTSNRHSRRAEKAMKRKNKMK